MNAFRKNFTICKAQKQNRQAAHGSLVKTARIWYNIHHLAAKNAKHLQQKEYYYARFF
jgi:DNA polymerase III delta subunit